MNPKKTLNFRTSVLVCLTLGLLTFALYSRTLRYDFIAYDDQQYVTENLHVQDGLTLGNLIWAFGYHASNWHPLTWLSHMLDCQLYGLKPGGHHLTNVLLHVANTVLLFLVFTRMTGRWEPSAAVAALFAWHPLHVESVAWIAERKDVLSAFFWMLTLWAYALYAKKRLSKNSKPTFWYGCALVFFALALMSKSMAVTLPFVLLLLDFWPLHRLQSKTVLLLLREKIPFFVLTGIACVLTICAQRRGYSVVSTTGLPILQRISHSLLAYLHYLEAIFVPCNLAVYYPYETEGPRAKIMLAASLLVVITILVCRSAARYPYLPVGWFWFLGTLIPVIGLVQVGDQAWADRYTYLPLIGVSVSLVWTIMESVSNNVVRSALAISVGVALYLGAGRQIGYWKDTRTLFQHTAEVTRNNAMAVTLLGSLLAKEGKLDQAMEDYRTALRYKPTYPEAHFFLGNAFAQQGKLDDAIGEYKRALWFKPTQEQTHLSLASALAKQNKLDEAAFHYTAALKLNPESAVAQNNFGRLLYTQGRINDALGHYEVALKLSPNFSPAHNNLGILLLQQGKLAEGTAHLREALRLNPGNLESQYNLALALNQQQKWEEAATLFAQANVAASNDPNAHYQFAAALFHLRRTREAMTHFASALLIQPDFPDALDGLGWILATATNQELRNGAEAIHMASRACELTARKDPVKLKTLAAAYAEVGQFERATLAVREARGIAENSGRPIFVNDCQIMEEYFKSGRPWREK